MYRFLDTVRAKGRSGNGRYGRQRGPAKSHRALVDVPEGKEGDWLDSARLHRGKDGNLLLQILWCTIGVPTEEAHTTLAPRFEKVLHLEKALRLEKGLHLEEAQPPENRGNPSNAWWSQ